MCEMCVSQAQCVRVESLESSQWLVSLSPHNTCRGIPHICLGLAVITFDEFTSTTKLLLKVVRITQVFHRRVQEYLGVCEAHMCMSSTSTGHAVILHSCERTVPVKDQDELFEN